jgi:hypothetical protein
MVIVIDDVDISAGAKWWDLMMAHLISQLEVKVLQQGSHSGHQADLGQRLAHAGAGALREREVALRPLALACRGKQ